MWWKLANGVPEFKGLKISQDAEACAKFKDVHHVRVLEPECNDLLVDQPGVIGSGGNSGFQAFNLAVQFGVTRIALVGFDMRLDQGAHWHGSHGRQLNNPSQDNVIKWRRTFNAAAQLLPALGVDVVNVSPDSALMAFPKMSLQEAMRRWRL